MIALGGFTMGWTMTDIIVHHIGIDNSWAFVETKGIRFEVGLTHDEDGLSSVTFSPVELTEEDMNLIENEVNTEPVKVEVSDV